MDKNITGFISEKERYKMTESDTDEIIGSVYDDDEYYLLAKPKSYNGCLGCEFYVRNTCYSSAINNIICKENNAIYKRGNSRYQVYESDQVTIDLEKVSRLCKDICIYYSEGCYNNQDNPCLIRLLQTLSTNP